MGVRLHAPTSKDFSTTNFGRATSLDKTKTDWFHEISNLFSITTDQVIGGHEITSELHGSDSTVKYHSRMLQNRAKLNMVVSMVERYARGALSVEKTRKPTSLNITPWTMVSPDDVCPVDRRNPEKDSIAKSNETVTLAEALETLTEDDSCSDTSSELSTMQSTDMTSPTSSLSEIANDHYNTDQESNGKSIEQNKSLISSVTARSNSEDSAADDLLAKACAMLNTHPNTIQDDSAGTLSCNVMPHLHSLQLSASVSSVPSESVSAPAKQPLTQTQALTQMNYSPKTLSRDNAEIAGKSVKVVSGKNLQSIIASGRKVMFLTPARATNGHAGLTPVSTIPSSKPKVGQKVIEIVPATLPDGRVIHLEVMRHVSPVKVTNMAEKNGRGNVVLPRNMNGKVLQRPVGRIVRANTNMAGLTQFRNGINVAANTTTVPVKNDITVGTGQNAVAMVCLKKPPIYTRTVAQESLKPLGNGQVVITGQRTESTYTANDYQNDPGSALRKRTHDGEIKMPWTTAEESVSADGETNFSAEPSDTLEHLFGQATETLPPVNDHPSTKEEDALNITLLNELMDQLPSTEDDEEIGSLCHGDILSDFLRQEEEKLPNKTEDHVQSDGQSTLEEIEPNENFSTGIGGFFTMNLPERGVACRSLSSTEQGPLATQAFSRRYQGKRSRSASNELKRTALSSIDTNSCLRNTSDVSKSDPDMSKPKRKYTKRVEMKHGTDDKTKIILGPTAAAAAKNPYQKPPLPYNILIYLAFKDVGFRCLTVKRIYNFILKTFPYFTQAHQTWQNAIRHQLCCCKNYEKVPITEFENGIEKSAGKSAWKVLNDDCIRKLKDDAITTLAKGDNIERLKESLSDSASFESLCGELVDGLEDRVEQSNKHVLGLCRAVSNHKKPSLIAPRENNIARSGQDFSFSAASYTLSAGNEVQNVSSELSLFEELTDQQHSLYFDFSPKILDMSSIYSI